MDDDDDDDEKEEVSETFDVLFPFYINYNFSVIAFDIFFKGY